MQVCRFVGFAVLTDDTLFANKNSLFAFAVQPRARSKVTGYDRNGKRFPLSEGKGLRAENPRREAVNGNDHVRQSSISLPSSRRMKRSCSGAETSRMQR